MDIRSVFPCVLVYHLWTSRMVLDELRDVIHVALQISSILEHIPSRPSTRRSHVFSYHPLPMFSRLVT